MYIFDIAITRFEINFYFIHFSLNKSIQYNFNPISMKLVHFGFVVLLQKDKE